MSQFSAQIHRWLPSDFLSFYEHTNSCPPRQALNILKNGIILNAFSLQTRTKKPNSPFKLRKEAQKSVVWWAGDDFKFNPLSVMLNSLQTEELTLLTAWGILQSNFKLHLSSLLKLGAEVGKWSNQEKEKRRLAKISLSPTTFVLKSSRTLSGCSSFSSIPNRGYKM